MTAISTLPLNPVTSTTVDYDTILGQARGGPEEPWPIYEWGNGRKIFWSNFADEGIYGKPTIVIDGVTIHLPDPDLI